MLWSSQRPYRTVLLILAVVLGYWAVAEPVHAQEFDCTASVDYSQLSGARYTYLDELAQDVEEYYNDRAWTQDRYLEFERIECSIQIIIQESLTLTNFRARLILTSFRPIYGTTQQTRILQVNDADWQFEYAQGTPLIFELQTFHPLSSLLDFYGYLMLGYDYDTFSELGGTEHFDRARRIVELAQAQSAAGWSQIGSERSRATLIEGLLDPRYQPLRKAYFTYHFDGLDHFLSETDNARRTVLTVLEDLLIFYQEVSRNYPLDLFFSSKYQEIAAMLSQSPEAGQAYAVLRELDASHLSTYEAMVQ